MTAMGDGNAPPGDYLRPGLFSSMGECFSDNLLLKESVMASRQRGFLLHGGHQSGFQFRELVFHLLCQLEIIAFVTLGDPGSQCGTGEGCDSESVQHGGGRPDELGFLGQQAGSDQREDGPNDGHRGPEPKAGISLANLLKLFDKSFFNHEVSFASDV